MNQELQAHILVTGANGQLGMEIRELAPAFPFVFHFTDIGELNLLDFDAIKDFLTKNKVQYLINCAAYTAVDKAESEPDIALALNSEAVANLSRLTMDMGIRLIHISTDYVFSGYMPRPLTELDDPLPETVYGVTKLEGEKHLATHPGAMIIRTSWLYSSYGRNFLKTILHKLNETDDIKVVYDQTGTPTYAADLAHAVLGILSSVQSGQKSFIPGIFHYSGDGVCSWYDFAREIAVQTGSKCRIIPVETREFPSPAPRPWYSVLSKEKIRNIYGLNIPYWRDSLEVCLKKL